MRLPRMTTRRRMIAVAVIAMLLTVTDRGCYHLYMASIADTSRENAKYYAEKERNETNPAYRSTYAQWKRAMEYYARNPEEHPHCVPLLPWWRCSPRNAFVGPEGAP